MIAALFLLSQPVLAGQISLEDSVRAGAPIGATTDEVTAAIGAPQRVRPSVRVAGAQAWYYDVGHESCGLTIKDKKVVAVACGLSPAGSAHQQRESAQTRHGIADALKAFGDGMSGKKKTHCESRVSGDTVTTDCDQ